MFDSYEDVIVVNYLSNSKTYIYVSEFIKPFSLYRFTNYKIYPVEASVLLISIHIFDNKTV